MGLAKGIKAYWSLKPVFRQIDLTSGAHNQSTFLKWPVQHHIQAWQRDFWFHAKAALPKQRNWKCWYSIRSNSNCSWSEVTLVRRTHLWWWHPEVDDILGTVRHIHLRLLTPLQCWEVCLPQTLPEGRRSQGHHWGTLQVRWSLWRGNQMPERQVQSPKANPWSTCTKDC